ncbi:substrate-binding periplasmic protein [Azospira restricta]|uniref:Transporter substrate-binding domain-containing protein n=1 Tax=Azospira restricta TaxID=404405 RepID=A0A974PY29_9RHOO|nr:transporter substrate-binding domain-containing protein [Azospira restricta]QRJ63095.1 transporter substrate-binding domain-containing protein [Azospira restricta]
MKTDRRACLRALAALPLWLALPAAADDLETIRSRGRLRIAVYNDFPPYALRGKGIDIDLGRAIAEKLGLAPEIVGFNADEDMNDDLRNMVWKGHYLGTQPADVMMHVPVDEHLARANDKVRILAPYHRESLALARDPSRIPNALSGSAAVALEIFTREKVGVETTTLADAFLLGALNGRLHDNIVHYRSVAEAAAGLKAGKVAAVLAPQGELEAALTAETRFAIDAARFAELKIDGWPLGLAVKAEQSSLAEALAAAVAELKQDGTVAAIFKRHGITYQPA